MTTAAAVAQKLGVRWPLIQAPMAGVQDAQLAIAVSRAGALGSLPAAMMAADQLGQEIETIKQAGVEAYNVNFFCHTTPAADPAREVAWQQVLRPYYDEFGIDPNSVTAGAGRAPFDQAALEVLKRLRPPVVSFHFGLPVAELLHEVQALGCCVLSSATTANEAAWLDQQGVDIIIAQGVEAGGHRGMFLDDDVETQAPLAELLPSVLATTNKCVIAAGGIGDAQDIQRWMNLGAAGVQIGTSYLMCDEATTRAVHREALRRESPETVLTNVFSGRPARGIRNRLIDEVGPMSEHAPAFPQAAHAVAPLRAAGEANGVGDFSPLWSGANRTGCRAIPAADLTRELIAGFSA